MALADFMMKVFPSELSFILAFIQALGGLIVIYIIISLVNFYFNRKKNKKLDATLSKIDKIERDIQNIKEYIKNKKR